MEENERKNEAEDEAKCASQCDGTGECEGTGENVPQHGEPTWKDSERIGDEKQEKSSAETLVKAEHGLPKADSEPILGLRFPEASVTLRTRRPRIGIRMAGVAAAVFFLLLAVLLAISAVGKRGTGAETTGTVTATAPESNAPTETAPIEMDLYRFDPSQIPSGHIGFRPMDLASTSSEWENQTALALDSAAILSDFNTRYPETAERIEQDADQPLVLILHTHTTEGYSAEGAISWDGTGDFARSEDGESGVRAVGAVLADRLRRNGIPTVHCVLSHDRDAEGNVSNAGSYARAAETIQHYRALYPSIRYVFDLHRDVVFDESGNAIRPIASVGGEAVAEVRAVAGVADGKGTDHLAMLLRVTDALRKSGALARTAVVKDAPLHADLADFSLTFEIGSAANSLSEAKRAAVYLGDALAEIIYHVEGGARGE